MSRRQRALGLWGLGGALALLALACTEADPMQIWIGRDGSELIQTWGQPTEELSRADSGKTIVYTNHWLNGFGATHICRRLFTTSVTGVITGHSASDC
jgi:hypothetical protein